MTQDLSKLWHLQYAPAGTVFISLTASLIIFLISCLNVMLQSHDNFYLSFLLFCMISLTIMGFFFSYFKLKTKYGYGFRNIPRSASIAMASGVLTMMIGLFLLVVPQLGQPASGGWGWPGTIIVGLLYIFMFAVGLAILGGIVFLALWQPKPKTL